MPDYYTTARDAKTKEPIGCVELVESFDDDGWYAHEYDFTRKDNATRTSRRIYSTRSALVRALDDGKHKWGTWS